MTLLEVRASGHRSLTATHAKTLELARSGDLGERASCVVGADASYDLEAAAALCGPVCVDLVVGDESFTVRARVAPLPSVGDGLVLRRSDCPGGRTFAHSASAGAADLPRSIASRLADPATEIRAVVSQEDGPGSLVVTPGAPDDVPRGFDGSAGELLEVLRRPARAALAVPVLDRRAVIAATLVRIAADAGAEIAVARGAPHPLRALAGSGIAGAEATFLAVPSGRRDAERVSRAASASAVATVMGPADAGDLIGALDGVPADRAACLLLDPGGACERTVHGPAATCAERLGTVRGAAIAVIAPGAAALSPEIEGLVRTLDVPPSDLARALAAALGMRRGEAYEHVRRLRGG